MGDYDQLPPDLPVPADDGAAEHLPGLPIPSLRLPATEGGRRDLAELAGSLLVAYLYPRTGVPGTPMPEGWDAIPGARGCTPQSCAYRDSRVDFAELGAVVVGVSAQPAGEQREFAAREHIPFPLLSDPDLKLAGALRLPTFEVDGRTLYRRLTLVAEGGVVTRAFYPVFPPDRDAAAVLDWLRNRRGPPRVREAVRVLLLDEEDRLLLFSGERPETKTPFWFPAGGGVAEGEDARIAAVREVAEETGLDRLDVGPEVWHRRHIFAWRGVVWDQRERWFLARVSHFEPSRHRMTPTEREEIIDCRWWALAEMERTTDELVPRDLPRRLRELIAEGPPASPIEIGR